MKSLTDPGARELSGGKGCARSWRAEAGPDHVKVRLLLWFWKQ